MPSFECRHRVRFIDEGVVYYIPPPASHSYCTICRGSCCLACCLAKRWCPDGCEPAPAPGALPDFNNFPCVHRVGERSGADALQDAVAALYKFDLLDDGAVCAEFQVDSLCVALAVRGPPSPLNVLVLLLLGCLHR